MYSNILLPIDLGHIERTDGMLSSIGDIAGNPDVRLTLLHVIPVMPSYIASQLPPNLHQTAMTEAKASLDALVKKHNLSDATTTMAEHGHPFQFILKTATDIKADLIVIGSHQPGPSDFLLGSVASKVVRHAKCSVLVVR